MKAVIMAGGEGSRLRPLTCDNPKPMARLCGHPVLEYILDLLLENGVDEAVITMRYLPQKITEFFENGKYKDIKLRFVEEEIPLGTAGSVKNAALFTEDFVVISGDAMCDVNLMAAYESHKQNGAEVTIITKRVNDPREYGLVTTNEGVVTGFVEKPAWSGVTTNLANTGIYILSPSVLDDIPSGRSYDFAANLFPTMLESGKKIMSWCTDDYWCDIGDLQSYLNCQTDIISKRVKSSFLNEQKTDVFCDEQLPKGEYKIFPPVYLGCGVKIEQGAIIGPDSIIDDGVTIAEGARIRSSAVLSGAMIGANARLTGAVVCGGATIKNGASLFEGSVVGSGASVGENSEILPNISIWPGKRVEAGTRVSDNLRYGTAKIDFFDDDGISGEAGVEITPEFCAKLGAAAGSLKSGNRVGVGYSGNSAAKAFKDSFSAGVLSTGAQVWDFGKLMESQMAFATSFCGLSAAMYIISGPKCILELLGEGGLPATRGQERELQNHLTRGEFVRCGWSGYRDVTDMRGVLTLYQQELYRIAPMGLSGMEATVKCPLDEGERLFEDTLIRLGCDINKGPTFHLSQCGTKVSISTEKGEYVPFERVLALCCSLEFDHGRDVILPYSAPRIIDRIAEIKERKAYRYLSCPASDSDNDIRSRSKNQMWMRDGIMLSLYLLSEMKQSDKTISRLLEQVPGFVTIKRKIDVNEQPAALMDKLGGDHPNEGDGVLIKNGGFSVLVHPSKQGKSLHLLAEAGDAETAAELCDGIEFKIKKATLDSTEQKG